MPGSVLWSGLWRPPASVKSVNGPLASCLTDEATSGEFVLCQQLTQIHGKCTECTNPAVRRGRYRYDPQTWNSTSLQSSHWIEFDELCTDGFTNQFVFHKSGLIAVHHMQQKISTSHDLILLYVRLWSVQLYWFIVWSYWEDAGCSDHFYSVHVQSAVWFTDCRVHEALAEVMFSSSWLTPFLNSACN